MRYSTNTIIPVLLTLIGLAACQKGEGELDSPPGSGDSETPDSESSDSESPDSESPDSGPQHSGDTGAAGLPSLFALSATPRNLLVISLDTLRRSDVGYLGGGSDTPFLDSLMTSGVVLETHRSCSSWTYPGSICAMTGASPAELGFFPVVPEAGEEALSLPDGSPTLAADMAAVGFQTSLLTSNGYLGARTGLATGFDDLGTSVGWDAEGITKEALAQLDLSIDTTSPWMLHVHYIDPHASYDPPVEYLTALEDLPAIPWDLSDEDESLAAMSSYPSLSADEQEALLAHVRVRYEGEVRYMDNEIGTLFEQLELRGLLEDTMVMVWSDHGEQFFEHDSFGHAGTLFGEENDALAFFWSPLLAAGTWTAPTTHEDLPPTALALMGAPADAAMTGLIAGIAEDDRPIFATVIPHGGQPIQSITVGDTKLMYSWTGRKSLFHRDTDAAETTDLYDVESTEVVELWELLLPKVMELDRATEDYVPVGPGA